MRVDGRPPDALRPVVMTLGFMPYAEGSCLVEMGDTKVICSATIDDGVPKWMQGRGRGWVTAEYAMLPRSSPQRIQREVNRGRPGGRTQEIQRLIGRSLRAIVDGDALGERTLWVDCDVLQADGGTRTASITGAFVALAQAFAKLRDDGIISLWPLIDSVSAVSVGIVDGTPCLDLNYAEDSTASVDMNVVMTGAGKLVEVQGTAEQGVFDRNELELLLDLATKGIGDLTAKQEAVLGASDPEY
ncbi:MAG TPA: ribonuclease PH [Actinomycetota bacterium]|nr:ribonuclease PH [Actinomycetota bacterium]